MKRKNFCVFDMVLCAFMWSTAGIFMKFIPWHPLALSGIRSSIAALVIAAFFIVCRARPIINRTTLASGISLCLTFTFFVAANKLTTAANAIVLQFTSPIFIVIISAAFFHKTFERRDLLAVLFTMVGIAIFVFNGLSGGGIKGDICAIVAGITMALMYIINGECGLRERMSGILLALVMSFIIGLPFIFGGEPLALSKAAVGSVVFLGIAQLGIPYILYARAAEGCPALACCLIGAIEPLLNPVWVFLFDGETPGVMAILGGVIVIGTVTVWNLLSTIAEKKAEVHDAH